MGVIELKRSSVSVTEGIRQNSIIKKDFIRNFPPRFNWWWPAMIPRASAMEWLKLWKILEWKENVENPHSNPLITTSVWQQSRFLQLIHDFIVFDSIKKTCRHNQSLGEAAQERLLKVKEVSSGTLKPGKSLTMVGLAKWIRENVQDSRVLIITDRTELGTNWKGFLRCGWRNLSHQEWRWLIAIINPTHGWSVHWFTSLDASLKEDNTATEKFIENYESLYLADFKAMRLLFLSMSATELSRANSIRRWKPSYQRRCSLASPVLHWCAMTSCACRSFGPYIHTYKFDAAVRDGVVLDLPTKPVTSISIWPPKRRRMVWCQDGSTFLPPRRRSNSVGDDNVLLPLTFAKIVNDIVWTWKPSRVWWMVGATPCWWFPVSMKLVGLQPVQPNPSYNLAV